MTNNDNPVAGTESSTTTSCRVGLYSAILTVLITVLTFSLAITAIPNSGAGCRENCFRYPYVNSLSEFPRDYLWMPPAMLLVVVYVILVVAIHAYAAQHKKIYSQIGLSFALIAAGILLGDYYIQFSVVPISLMNQETDGIALLTQYNANGIFIVLEELGYLLMSLSFVFLAPVFANISRLASVVRWVFIAGFVLTIAFLAVISINYGLAREDRFEIAVISIDWLVLVINGVLLSLVFRRQLKVRIASGVAVGVYVLAALIVAGRAGFRSVPLTYGFLRWGTWVLVGLMFLGALENFASLRLGERKTP